MSTVLEHHLPQLCGRTYSLTSPKSKGYNCIAWAAGDNGRWWWPSPVGYWPVGNVAETIEAFVEAFGTLGYQPCTSASLELGYDKVALYADGSRPTHMARQLPDGRWTSKCGRLEDITHSLADLEGGSYGTVTLMMRRTRA